MPRRFPPLPCRSISRATEWAYLVGALLALTLGPVYQLRIRMAPLGEDFTSDLTTQSVFFVLYTVAAVLLARRTLPWGAARVVLASTSGLCAVLLLSVGWSVDKIHSLPSAALTAMTAVFGAYLGLCWTAAELMIGLYISSLVGVAASLWAVQRHWVGAKDYSADWAGIYFNRNSLGPVAALALLAGAFVVAERAVLAWKARGALRRNAAATAMLAALPLYTCARVLKHTRSSTPLAGLVGSVATVAVALGALVVWRSSPRRRLAVPSAVVVASMMGAVAVDLGRDRLAVEVDKLPTLSGRTIIWEVVRRWFHLRPRKGWGWNGVWRYGPFREDLDATGYHVFSAHSGYLEVALGAGWFGVAALVVCLGAVVGSTLELLGRRPGVGALAMLAVVAYCLIVNLGETYIGANLLPWTLLVGCGVAAAVSAQRPSDDPADVAPEAPAPVSDR